MNKTKQFITRGFLVFFLFSLTLSCGGECDFRTQGICVIFDGPKYEKQEVYDAVEALSETLDEYLIDSPNLKKMFKEKDVHVTFVDYDMQIDCEKKERTIYECTNIYGVNYSSNDIYVEWRKCIAFTAFAHELLHTVEHDLFNVGPGSPHQPPLFNDNMENPWESIEYKAYRNIFWKVCYESN